MDDYSVHHRLALAAMFGGYVKDLLARDGSLLYIDAVAVRAFREARLAMAMGAAVPRTE